MVTVFLEYNRIIVCQILFYPWYTKCSFLTLISMPFLFVITAIPMMIALAIHNTVQYMVLSHKQNDMNALITEDIHLNPYTHWTKIFLKRIG